MTQAIQRPCLPRTIFQQSRIPQQPPKCAVDSVGLIARAEAEYGVWNAAGLAIRLSIDL